MTVSQTFVRLCIVAHLWSFMIRRWYYSTTGLSWVSSMVLSSPPSGDPVSSHDWSSPPAATAPRGQHYRAVGVSLKALRGEKRWCWFSIRSSPPLLLSVWGSLTCLIIQGTCRADWQLNEATIAGLLQAPFHGFCLCMTNPTQSNIPLATTPKPSFSLFFLSTCPAYPTTVLPLLCWLRFPKLLLLVKYQQIITKKV